MPRKKKGGGLPRSPPMLTSFNDFQRFHDRIEKLENGCWRWTGHYSGRNKTPDFFVKGRRRSARRIAWYMYKGEKPPPRVLLTSCGNKWCVNPNHAVVKRGVGMLEFCHRGHKMTPENKYVTSDGKHVACRECIKLNTAAYRRKNRDKINAYKRKYSKERKSADVASEATAGGVNRGAGGRSGEAGDEHVPETADSGSDGVTEGAV